MTFPWMERRFSVLVITSCLFFGFSQISFVAAAPLENRTEQQQINQRDRQQAQARQDRNQERDVFL